MINAAVRGYALDEAEGYLEEMKCRKVNPNQVTYTTLIRGATNLFDLCKAKHYFGTMIKSGVPPNVRTFNTLLRGCYRTGDADYAKQLLPIMQNHHVNPDHVTLELITMIEAQSMQMIESVNTLDKLVNLISKNKKEGVYYRFKPSLYLMLASTSVVGGYPLKKAKKLLQTFETAAAEPDLGKSTPSNLPAEIWKEFNCLKQFLEKNEGLPKEATQVTSKGPKTSPFVLSYPSNLNPTEFFNQIPKRHGDVNLVYKLEICTGSGDWLLNRCKNAEANCHWIGLEIRYDRVHEIWRKCILTGCDKQLSIIHADANYLTQIFPANSISEVYINFPDPPLQKDSPQRLITKSFLERLAGIVVKGGQVVVLTDDLEYSHWIEEDAQLLESIFDNSKTKVDTNFQEYGTSFFDELWERRGRKERRWLTLSVV